ncbi:MAG: histone acetylation protein-domain-containing protein [Linnemannia elongata]|nr:MAG: histone acetylation protein-domain-containing protein [Linnemannia elongata]
MSHSFVFDNKDDPILHSIAQELHTTLNQQPTTSTTHESDHSSTTTDSASLHTYEFRLESFLTRPRTCTTLFPPRVQKSRYSQIHVQERLVLLSAGPSSSPSSPADNSNGNNTDKDEKKNEATPVLIAGLEVLEYTLTPLSPPSPSPSGNKAPQRREERIIYIAKVDTSGFWPLPGLERVSLRGKSPAQALVKGYLRSVRATSRHGLSLSTDITATGTKDNNCGGSDTTNSAAATVAAAGKMSALSITSTPTTAHHRRPRKTSLYIFARAQPQYLFANSAKNPQKRVLDDRGLVRWWKNTAASVYAESMDPSTTTTTTIQDQDQEQAGRKPSGNRKTKVQGWWHIPGIETERQAHNVIQSATATNNSKSFEWIYGYPDKDSKELANALIPQFPDDPKSRMMQSPSCQGGFVNIRTFWELAAIGEESGAGKITGFFRIVEEDEGEDEGEEEEGEEIQEKAVTGTTAGYTKVINSLLDLEFSTMEDARMSTRKWQDRVEVWIRKSVEREAERVLEVEAARRQEQEKEGGKKEDEKEEKKEAVVAVKPLWIQKGSVEIMLCHGSDIPPTLSPVVATQEPTTTATVATPAATPAVVNTLSIGLIKRKAPTPASTTATTATTTTAASTTATPAVNVLGAGLIKRKVVASTVSDSNATPAPAAAAAPVVNVLGAGLIKRKVSPTSTTPPTTTITMPETSSTAPVVNVLGACFIKKRKTDS